ncbi:MAG: DUF2207 domain-containing protein [Eubacterium sp.]|nr:DUF2207 domain-containing protein [Eubacterium sp.]
MKSAKKICLFLVAFILLVSSAVPAFAAKNFTAYSGKKHPTKDYYFESYDVSINVLENNTLEITEKISAYFNIDKHGIYREIPTTNYVERADGSTDVIDAKVKNVSVSENYEADTDGNYYVIRIGDEDRTVLGPRDYTISYSYVMGKDVGVDFDELYFNLIGDEWDTYINNVTFKVTMPKEFDAKKVGLSTGSYGTVGTDTIEYKVSGNEISGKVTEELKPGEALTLRVELPDGYFYFNMTEYYISLAAMVVIPLIALIIVFLLWYKFGRDKKVVEVVEFYPPDQMSSLDVAFWKQGLVTSKDTIPLMIELANEGYIKINQVEKKKLIGSKTDFVIERAKNTYYGNDACKRVFFDGLFINKNAVTSKDLKNKFYKTIEKITTMVNTPENKKLVFDAKSMRMVLVGVVLSILSIVASIAIHSETIGGNEKTIAVVAGVAVGVISAIFSFFVRRRTDKGYEYLQRIMGFKKFLETAEKEKLEMLVEENPEYYYDILPYAYVLGVSDKWTKNFESIAIEPPTWYSGSVFDRIWFYHFINSTFKSTSTAMTSSQQS